MRSTSTSCPGRCRKTGCAVEGVAPGSAPHDGAARGRQDHARQADRGRQRCLAADTRRVDGAALWGVRCGWQAGCARRAAHLGRVPRGAGRSLGDSRLRVLVAGRALRHTSHRREGRRRLHVALSAPSRSRAPAPSERAVGDRLVVDVRDEPYRPRPIRGVICATDGPRGRRGPDARPTPRARWLGKLGVRALALTAALRLDALSRRCDGRAQVPGPRVAQPTGHAVVPVRGHLIRPGTR